MDDQIDAGLLERFLAGECSPLEREHVVRWVDGNPERQALLNALRMTWARIGSSGRRYDAASAWASVSARLHTPGREDSAPHSSRRAFQAVPRGLDWRAAASLLVVIGLGGAGVWWYQAGRAPHRAPLTTSVAMREVVTPRGQRATIRLSDGSRVTLAPASRLRESSSFGVGSRDVWLEGEAYFDVVHKAVTPFRVHVAGAVARDLGTRFLVRAYPDARDVRVVVAEGSVALARERDTLAGVPARLSGVAQDSVVLRARDLGRLDAGDRLTVESRVALDDYVAWTEGRLVFTEAPLGDVIPRLSRWYDIDLRLRDSALARERFSATLTHEPLSDVLQLLAATVRGRIERRGDTLILLRRGQR